MPLADLSKKEREVIKECLRAAVEGPFFPDWEFPLLIGLDREELRKILNSWPELDETDESVRIAINNSLNNLLGYPHGCEKEWPLYVSVTRQELARIFSRWRREKVRGYFEELM